MNAGTPAIELITGPYRCGKTTLLIDRLLDLKEENPFASVLVIVPSARYGRLFKERLCKSLQARKTEGGIFAVSVEPFYQACAGVLRRSIGEPLLLADEIRPALLNKLLNVLDLQGRIPGLKDIAEFHGTALSLLELIDEFQRAGLSPAELRLRLEEYSCTESQLLELAGVYEAYVSKLQELGFYDQKSLAMKAREELFAAGEICRDLLLVDGFDRVSHLQAQIFAGFARASAQSLIAFDYCCPGLPEASRHSAYFQSPADYAWKESSLKELLDNLNPERLEIPLLLSEEPEAGNLPQSEAVCLLDPFLEAYELSKRVKAALLERHLSPSDLIVVVRSPDSYNGALELAFEEAGIPYFIDGSSKVCELPLWNFIARVFSLAEKDFARKDLIDILRSPYANLDELAITAKELSRLDRNSFNARLIGGIAQWRKFLAAGEYAEFAAPLLCFIEELSASGLRSKMSEHILRFEKLLERYVRLPASDADLRSLASVREREVIKAIRRSLQVLLTQEQVLEEPEGDFALFWQKLHFLVEQSNYPRPRPQEPCVTVCAAELVQNRRFREIYIAGMVEGEFPRHQRSSGFLSTDQLGLWLSFGIDIRNPRHEPGFERALFYSLTERASERLCFTLSEYNSKSEENISSFYISELQDKVEIKALSRAPFSGAVEKPLSVRELIGGGLWTYGVEGAEIISTCNAGVERRWSDFKEKISACLHRGKFDSANIFNGDLSDFFATGAFSTAGIVERWTASKINDYGKCPFRFWASHVLKLEPREEAKAGLNFAIVGQFYHKVLELFYGTIKSVSDDELALGMRPYLERAFADAVVWLENRSDFLPGPYWEQEKKELYFRLNRFVEKDLDKSDFRTAGFRPAMFEVNFGTERSGSYPALSVVGADGSTINVSGSIDRIDLSSAGSLKSARIVDYKSGSRKISSKEAEEGRNLQLPVYALALEQVILPGYKVELADYLSISAAQSVGVLNFESEKHLGLKARALELLREFSAAASAGKFNVRPNGISVCKDCLHKAVCRVSELKVEQPEEYDAVAD